MRIRPVQVNDVEWLGSLSTETNKLPNPNHIITSGIVDKSGSRLGFGVIRNFAEAVIMLESKITNRLKAKVILLLFKQAIEDCKAAKLDEINCFVDDPVYADLLIKHFGFRRHTGIALIKEL